MDESEFRKKAEDIYRNVLARLDQEDPDEVEAEQSAGVVRIRTGRGQTYILNHQAPLREMWYAAGDRAWHCRAVDGRWVDPRTNDDLEAVLGATLTAAVGKPIQFSLPK